MYGMNLYVFSNGYKCYLGYLADALSFIISTCKDGESLSINTFIAVSLCYFTRDVLMVCEKEKQWECLEEVWLRLSRLSLPMDVAICNQVKTRCFSILPFPDLLCFCVTI